MIHKYTDGEPYAEIRRRIESVTELPSMPEMAQALLRLTNNPQGNIQDLADIIQHDPSIAAQLMRYARSAFFGYSGEITSLQQAVSVVLGYSLSLDIALGIALGKTFNIPNFGPMGLYPFWRHAIFSAALCQRLAPQIRGMQPGLAFLGGLLHNFGVLLVAHLFRNEALQLAQRIEAAPERPVIEIEQEMMGADHPEIGAWLLRCWNLQPEIIAASEGHHAEAWTGEFAAYAHTVQLADRLLKRHGIGDAESTELPAALLDTLGLEVETLEQALEAVMADSPGLDLLAHAFPR